MRRTKTALAAACLLAWSGTLHAQAVTKPAPQAPARDEAPRINLKLDESDLRKLGPASSTGTPANAPAPAGTLPDLGGGVPAGSGVAGRGRSMEGSGPYPKDMNPNLR
jgi:hypothetical protein